MDSYITDEMRAALRDHVIVEEPGGEWFMAKPGDNWQSIVVGEFASRLIVVTDSFGLGASARGLVSPMGCSARWFASPGVGQEHLCSMFLTLEWQWEAAKGEIRWHIQQSRDENRCDWWLQNEAKLEMYMRRGTARSANGPPGRQEFENYMTLKLGGTFIEDGLPGFDFPRKQAGWLCAIQEKFRELYHDATKKVGNCQRRSGSNDCGRERA